MGLTPQSTCITDPSEYPTTLSLSPYTRLSRPSVSGRTAQNSGHGPPHHFGAVTCRARALIGSRRNVAVAGRSSGTALILRIIIIRRLFETAYRRSRRHQRRYGMSNCFPDITTQPESGGALASQRSMKRFPAPDGRPPRLLILRRPARPRSFTVMKSMAGLSRSTSPKQGLFR